MPRSSDNSYKQWIQNKIRSNLFLLFNIQLQKSSFLKKASLSELYLLSALQILILGRPQSIPAKSFLLASVIATNTYSIAKNGHALLETCEPTRQVTQLDTKEKMFLAHEMLLIVCSLIIGIILFGLDSEGIAANIVCAILFLPMWLMHHITASTLRCETERLRQEHQSTNAHTDSEHVIDIPMPTERNRYTTASYYHRIIVPLSNWFRGLTSTTYYVDADHGDGNNGEDSDHSIHIMVNEDSWSNDSEESNSSNETRSTYRTVLRHINGSIKAAVECEDRIRRAKECLPEESNTDDIDQTLKTQTSVKNQLSQTQQNLQRDATQTHNIS